jgi:hypothetical protein
MVEGLFWGCERHLRHEKREDDSLLQQPFRVV